MKIYKPLSLLIIVLFVFSSGRAAVINGGKGLPHTKAAWTQESGRLTVMANTSFWGKVAQRTSATTNIESAVTIWDVQGLISVNYGLGKHFSLDVTPIFYQDVNQGSSDEYPWDTHIGLKIGSYGSKASSLMYGLELISRFPTGERHNVIYNDYTAGTVEWGFTGLLSYALDPLYPEDSFNLHVNLGYRNHNDVGEELINPVSGGPYANEVEVLQPSQQANYAIGFTIPTESFDYGFEMFGNLWIQKPPRTAASRENYLFMNASVKYKAQRWFDFIVSGEYRLTSDNDETLGPRRAITGLPNYGTWRINAGARFTLLPTSVFRTSERDILMQKAQSRRELFEQIIKERRETESAEEELERIKDERRKAEKELERLRQILEGKGEGQ